MSQDFSDVNIMYKTLAERVAAGKMALRSTMFGRGGVISLVEDGDKVRFRVNLTGKTYDTITQAIRESQALNITELLSFGPGDRLIQRGSSTNSPAAIYESIYDSLQRLSKEEKAKLRSAGIDVKELKGFKVQYATLHGDEGTTGKKAVQQALNKLESRNLLKGVAMIDDEGAQVIQFRTETQLFDAYQTNLIMSMTGHDRLDPYLFGNLLARGDSSALAGKLAKVGKREKGFFARRQLSLSGDELSTFLNLPPKQQAKARGAKAASNVVKPRGQQAAKNIAGQTKSLFDSTLVLDPQYELLKIFASDEKDISRIKGLGKNAGKLALFYQGANPEDYFQDVLDAALSNSDLGQSAIDDLKESINIFKRGSRKGRWASDDLSKHLMDSFVGVAGLSAESKQAREGLIKNIYSSIEYAFDGADLINIRFLSAYRSRLKSEVSLLDRTISSASASYAEKEQAMLRKIEIENLLNNLRNLNDLQQITGRGYIPELRASIKTAFDAKTFKTGLEDVAMIISKFGTKAESSVSGKVEQLIIDNLGQATTDVYADQVLMAFQKNLLADKATREAMLMHGQSVLSKFQAILDSGVLPEEILTQLRESAGENIENLPYSMRLSALKSMSYAQELLAMYESGATLGNSPRMISRLQAFMAHQAYREKEGTVQGLIPNAYRFALDTEARIGAGRNEKRLLQGENAFHKVTSIKYGEAADDLLEMDQDILKFRVLGHKLYFAPGAMSQFRHSLGGFDLDDKGLPVIKMFSDKDGVNHFGFYIFRQPSGPQESIFSMANLDRDTIKALFDKEVFRENLNILTSDPDLIDKNLSSVERARLQLLKGILTGEMKDEYDEGVVEQAILDVYKFMEEQGVTKLGRLGKREAERIAEYGSSSLRVTADMLPPGATLDDYSPQLTEGKFYKLVTKSGEFDLSDELKEIVNSAPVNKKLKNSILNARTFEEMMQILGRGFPQDEESRALFATLYDKMVRQSGLEETGNLGSFVNRSALTQSVFDQYQDLVESVQDPELKRILQENFNIGTIAQEEAIDLKTTLTGTRELNVALMRAHAEGNAADEQRLASVIANLYGKSIDELGDGDVITLDMLGKHNLTELGKLMGYTSSIDIEDKYRIGLDRVLMEERLSTNVLDAKSLLEGRLKGMIQARDEGRAIAGIDDRISELQSVLQGTPENVLRYMRDRVALSDDSEYAGITSMRKIEQLLQEMFDTTGRSAISRMARDEILLGSETSEKAMSVAKFILQQNKNNLETLARISQQVATTQEEIAQKNLATIKLGNEIIKQINEARKVPGVSTEHLLNSLDILGANTGFNVRDLGFLLDQNIGEDSQELYQAALKMDKVRRVKFYSKFDQSTAKEVRRRLSLDAQNLGFMDELREQARGRIEQMQSNVDQTLEEAIYRTLAGDPGAIDDEGLRREAKKQVNILEALVEREVMGTDISDLEQMAPDIPTGMIDEGMEELIRAASGAEEGISTSAPVYKRIGEKLPELRDFFKNNKIAKGTALGIVGLVAGSLVYNSVRDRTAEDLNGPPLLPGGNPYESGYPTMSPQIPDFTMSGPQQNASYNVSVQGSHDQILKFNQAARGLVNGNTSTTIYNNLPSLTRDPYSEIGQSF